MRVCRIKMRNEREREMYISQIAIHEAYWLTRYVVSLDVVLPTAFKFIVRTLGICWKRMEGRGVS